MGRKGQIGRSGNASNSLESLRAERYYPTRRGREGGNSPGAPEQRGSGGAPTSAWRPPNVKPGFHLGSSGTRT